MRVRSVLRTDDEDTALLVDDEFSELVTDELRRGARLRGVGDVRLAKESRSVGLWDSLVLADVLCRYVINVALLLRGGCAHRQESFTRMISRETDARRQPQRLLPVQNIS